MTAVQQVQDQQRQYRNQKSALTRAIRSRDPEKVIAASKKAVGEWENWPYGWPDDWHRWNIALSDAYDWARSAYINGRSEQRPDPARFDIDNIRREVVLG